MSKILDNNPSIVAGKRVLELGCGSSGICSIAAARFANLVVPTDGDPQSLNLLRQNLAENLPPNLLEKMVVKKLLWGSEEDISGMSHLEFDVVIGTDVTYVPEAIVPLFETARKLVQRAVDPVLILCHVQRRVSEDCILEAASRSGFKLVDRLMNGVCTGDGIIRSWFSGDCQEGLLQGSVVNIMCFRLS